MSAKENLIEEINKLKEHSRKVIENNNWQDVDYNVDSRDFEEGYLLALADMMRIIQKMDI